MPTKERIGLFAGPISFFIILYFIDLEGLSPSGKSVLASASWMAIWWITEAVPLAITALLPLILFTLTGALPMKTTASPFSHPYIFLYLGGFFIAIAIEKWNLHKRMALGIIKAIGTNMIFIILGFMVGTAFLSMWISNTAAAVMILPVGMAIIKQLKDNSETVTQEQENFGKALMLSIAYAASIGGVATLIGTPPNLILAGVVKESFGITITFKDWFVFGFPFSVLMLFICWYYLTHIAYRFKQKAFPGGRKEIQNQLKSLGKISNNELKVLVVFVGTAFAWISKSFLLVKIIPEIDDTVIALVGGSILFLLPANKKTKERLLSWGDMGKIPWDIILLFGGGMALAAGFEESGLAEWIGSQFSNLAGLHLFLLMLLIIASVNFLTEFTSNLATTAMLLPVLISIAASAGVPANFLMIGATIAASCAFMLPVATPPNAIVFGAGHLKISEMVKAGFGLNIVSIFLAAIAVYFLIPIIGGSLSF